MPGCPRRMLVRPGEIGVYHCWNRCVQRAWLCGKDLVTGIDYEYRRAVIEEVEQQLARSRQIAATAVRYFLVYGDSLRTLVTSFQPRIEYKRDILGTSVRLPELGR